MKKVFLSAMIALLMIYLAPNMASASSITLNCPGGLQSAPSITFGGSGIPNNAVCIATVGNDVTIALTATARYDNPVVTNNGTDTFFAPSGADTNSVNPNPAYAKWNFDWYAHNASTTASYIVDLLWDTDPGFGTDTSSMGYISQVLASGATAQNSFNLGMGFVDTGVPTPPNYAPAATIFDPIVPGEFSFSMNVRQVLQVPDVNNNQPLGSIGMNVNTGASPVPEPASLILLGTGLIGAGWARKKYRKE